MYDSAGTYNHSFLLFGLLLIIAVPLLFLLNVLEKVQTRKNQQTIKTETGSPKEDELAIELAVNCPVLWKESCV